MHWKKVLLLKKSSERVRGVTMRKKMILLMVMVCLMLFACTSPVVYDDAGEKAGNVQTGDLPFKAAKLVRSASGMILADSRSENAGTYTNIALHKPVVVSSNYSSNYYSTNAVDGLAHTAWGSSAEPNSQWIYVDLLAIKKIKGIGLKWASGYHATAYTIYTSDDKRNWKAVFNNLSGTGGYEKIIGRLQSRYMGILMTQKAGKDMYGLYEFEIYEDDTVDFSNYDVLRKDINNLREYRKIYAHNNYIFILEKFNKYNDILKLCLGNGLNTPIEISSRYIPVSNTIVFKGNYGFMATSKGLYRLDFTKINDVTITRINDSVTYDLMIAGDYLYVDYYKTNDGRKFDVVDISDPGNLIVESTLEWKSTYKSCINGDMLYVKENNIPDIIVYDITDKKNPVQTQTIPASSEITHMVIENNQLYGAYKNVVEKFDIADLSNVTSESVILPEDDIVREIYIENNYLTCVREVMNSFSKKHLFFYDVGDFTGIQELKKMELNDYYTKGYARLDSFLYILDGRVGIKAIDLTNPSYPHFANTFRTHGISKRVDYIKQFALVSENGSGLSVFDMTDYNNPRHVQTIEPYARLFEHMDICVVDDYIYVCDAYNFFGSETWLKVFTISSTGVLEEISSIYMGMLTGKKMYRRGTLLYVDTYDSVIIYDIANPRYTIKIGTIKPEDKFTIRSIDIHNNVLYMVRHKYGEGYRLTTYDVTNPRSPSLIKNIRFSEIHMPVTKPKTIYIHENYAYIGNETNSVDIYDISNPYGTAYVSTISISGGIKDIHRRDNHVFIGTASGITIFDLSDICNPVLVKEIGIYSEVHEFCLKDELIYAASGKKGLIVIGNK